MVNYSYIVNLVNYMHNHLGMGNILLQQDVVYILLQINCYIGNGTTKCHNRSMSDNRDVTETFHQKILHIIRSLHQPSRYFQFHEYAHNVTNLVYYHFL